jgi:hypothetical protein
VACPRTAAAPATTNLRPVARIDASNAAWPPGAPIPRGQVRLEHVADLALGDGRLGAGSGWEAATGQVELRTVAAGPVVAPVTLAVLDSPQAGRRVAFAEVRIGAALPVRWSLEPGLGIGTDGGDGGFVSGPARQVEGDDELIDGYVDAFYPGGDYAGHVCVRRVTPDGAPDALLFSTGYGDGGYPTFAGRDADGRVVSVVSFGGVLPWAYGGLPGRPPPRDAIE